MLSKHRSVAPATEVYLLHKAGEMAYLKDRSEQDIAAAYETAY